MSLIWQNLSFTGEGTIWEKLRGCCCACCFAPKQPPILSKLNGIVKIGELTALMGPSGAGKSTLLRCITEGSNCNGFDGQIFTEEVEDVRACFITQDEKDHLLLNLTVQESLWYASEMKNPPSTSSKQHQKIVTDLMEKLVLEAKTKVEKCSGGEKKRLAIGLELVSVQKPNFLFLDEPTSGLDSCAGLAVVRLLAELADSSFDPMAIVTTIHQPSFEIFSIFHQAYIISKAGNCIFSGCPRALKRHLIDSGYACRCLGYRLTRRCDCHEVDNPADTIIKIGSSVSRGFSANRDNNVVMVTLDPPPTEQDQNELKFLQNVCIRMTKTVGDDLRNGTNKRVHDRVRRDDGLCKNSANFSFRTLWVLFKRACITSIGRQRKLIFIRLALHAIVAAVLAGLYNRNLGLTTECFVRNSTDGPRNCSCGPTEEELRHESNTSQNVKFQFFSLLFLMFAALMPTVLTFPAEIKLFLNEHRNGWYTTLSYYSSKTITEIPLQLVFPFCYTYFLYWYSQQIGMEIWYDGLLFYKSWRYATFLGVTILSCFIAQGLGFLIGIMCVRSFSITVIVSSSVLLFLFLFSGFFVKTIQMSAAVEWITYFSFIRFSFESLLVIIFGFDRCEEIPGIPGVDPKKSESAILFIFNLADSDLMKNVFWLIGHLIVVRLLACFVLKSQADPKFFRTPTWVLRFVDRIWLSTAMTVCTACFIGIGKIVFKIILCGISLLIFIIILGAILNAIS